MHKEGSMVVLTVEDPGPGIPEAISKRIFKPFVTTKTRGTGLGLAIVEKRVQQLKGTVALTSPVSDHGTKFTVRFPDTSLET
jgi:signal transduction histidine kinase